MAIVLAIALVVTVVGFLIDRDRSESRVQAEREAHRVELQTLVNKLQHPQVYEPPLNGASTGPHHLPYDDSDAWQDWVDGNGS